MAVCKFVLNMNNNYVRGVDPKAMDRSGLCCRTHISE